MKRKLTALISAAALMLSLVACGSSSAPAAPSESAGNKTYTVGIVQLVPHVALDAATQGFKDALEEALPGQVKFEEGVGAGDSATCTPIVTNFVAANVDLIMANATPALQAAAAATAVEISVGRSVFHFFDFFRLFGKCERIFMPMLYRQMIIIRVEEIEFYVLTLNTSIRSDEHRFYFTVETKEFVIF